jgi:hypothetical protein
MADELSELLALWAARQRLTAWQVQAVRARVLAASENEAGLDVDWLWAMLRPVTELLEQMSGEDAAVPFTPYLRLA